MTATEIFRANHRTIRKALVTLERALLTQNPRWTVVAKNLAAYLDLELKEYWGSEERCVFGPLLDSGTDARGVVDEMLLGHRELEARLVEFKALADGEIGPDTAPLVREAGVALIKEFLHHMFLEEEVGFVLAEARLGIPYLEAQGERVLALREFARGQDEPAALD